MFRAVKQKLPEYKEQGAVIIDVRSPAEFAQGHVEGSFNIPLQSLAEKLDQFDVNKPVLLCCASGARSGVAVTILKNKGFRTVINGGPWSNLL